MADKVQIPREAPGPASEPSGGETLHQFGLTPPAHVPAYR